MKEFLKCVIENDKEFKRIKLIKNMERIPYEEWKKVYENSDIEIRLDPQEPDGYGLLIKKTDKYLDLPRGTLTDIGRSDRDTAKKMVYQLLPSHDQFFFVNYFKKTNLNLDSLVLAISEAHRTEEKRFEERDKEFRRKFNSKHL